MSLFKTSASDFAQKSGDVISIFSHTLEKLASLNAKIDKSKEDNEIKIVEAQAEVKYLENIAANNQRIMRNIENLLK